MILKYPLLIIGESGGIDWPKLNYIKDIREVDKKGIYFLELNDLRTKGHNSFKFVQFGVNLALKKQIDALITAPISKNNWIESGVKYKGHTQYLADSAGVDKYAMAFWSENMRTVLYSIHIPLLEVAPLIKKERIIDFISFVNTELTIKFKKKFKILVPGLNPHAGENGIMGSEEINEIIPAISVLKKSMDIDGPFPPDTIFLKALETKDSVVISWYHDQGLIPFKLLNINSGVNLTLGLPYIRTSPDHGTAFDIAGKDIANPSSMSEAILLAQLIQQSYEFWHPFVFYNNNSLHLF